jgi:glycosyltransferase involved in cell wall biosynthesis
MGYQVIFMGENIIYFSSDEWNSSLKTSQYHIALRLAQKCNVLYINSIGLRRPSATKRDLLKIKNKIKALFQGIKQVDTRLFVVSPVVLPFHQYRLVRKINQWLLILFVKYCQYKLRFAQPILITFLPNVHDLIGSFHEKKVVYYCADKMSSFKGVVPEVIEKMESALLQRADAVITTSRKLYEEKKTRNPNTYYMPHGVDFSLFNRVQQENLALPADLAGIRRPIIGFFGLISKDWVDFDLLKFLASRHPEWSLVMIGKIDEGVPAEITPFPNIYFLGPKDYERLPHYLKAFDVATIPFVISHLTDYCNPIKVKEYLAAGRPVVSVDLLQVREFSQIIDIAHNYLEFEQLLQANLAQDSPEKMCRRIDAVRNETWDQRAEAIFQLVCQ